ncbi:hypothetical protein [Kitasatospora sp. NPDC001175]|uniref:hypothetical protein n=1 Tax=Kitasatospora sp. NPDC001175 TaxID=3157103 RepID=UPI003CFF2364
MEDFDAVADRLYALAPDRFTAARNAAADQARHSGDRQLADRIRRLRRPTQSAWLANLLIRTDPAAVDRLLDLGHDLREAQERLEGERMRALTAQRHRLIDELVATARTAATVRAGQRAGKGALGELEQSLLAAIGDQVAADALAAGRLTEALPLASATTAGALAAPTLPDQPTAAAPARSTHRPSQRTDGRARTAEPSYISATTDQSDRVEQEWAERLDQAREAAARAKHDGDLARQAVRRIGRELERLAAVREKANRRAERAADMLRQARAEAEQAVQEQDDAERAYVRKQGEWEDARRAVKKAEWAAEAARRQVEELAAKAARRNGGR